MKKDVIMVSVTVILDMIHKASSNIGIDGTRYSRPSCRAYHQQEGPTLMTFSAMWLGIAWAIGFVLKKSTSGFESLFAISFIILSIVEIITERKLANFKEIFAILKAVITYFTFILICYIFMEANMKKPDDIVMLFVYALFPAMLTYGINRFVRKSDGNAKATKMVGTS